MPTKKIWLLVADASRASVFQCKPGLKDPQTKKNLEHPESRLRNSELVSDDRGRTKPRDRQAVGGSALPHSTSPHDVEAEKFSREIAGALLEAHRDKAYDELILVAPPTFLGLLTAALDKTVKKVVRGTVAKDYTAETPETVAGLVREQLDLP
jgi:protein required for attachment to host cells